MWWGDAVVRMVDDVPATVVDDLRRDIHGERVISARLCDYCGGTFSVDGSVLYEVVRYSEMGRFTELVGLDGSLWIPDAARCEGCARTTIEPATDGIAEVLVRVDVTESQQLLRIDASELEVVDYSPDTAGYHPPKIDLELVYAVDDPGWARWQRVKHALELAAVDPVIQERLTTAVSLSLERPPGVG